MPKTKQILARLKTARESKRVRHERLAAQLGIERTTYIRKENGFIPITTEEWLKLADALSVDASYFFACDNAGGGNGRRTVRDAGKESLILNLFRSLRPEERSDIITCMRIALKSVKRKDVKRVLSLL